MGLLHHLWCKLDSGKEITDSEILHLQQILCNKLFFMAILVLAGNIVAGVSI